MLIAIIMSQEYEGITGIISGLIRSYIFFTLQTIGKDRLEPKISLTVLALCKVQK